MTLFLPEVSALQCKSQKKDAVPPEKIQGDNLAKGTSYFQLLCVIDTRFHQKVLLNMQMFLKGECPFNDLKVLE